MSGADASKRDAAQPSEQGPREWGLSVGPDPPGSGRLRGVPREPRSCPQPTTAERDSWIGFGSSRNAPTGLGAVTAVKYNQPFLEAVPDFT